MLSLHGWAQAALQLLAPERCPGCDLDGSPGAALCGACLPLLERPIRNAPPSPRAAAYLYGGPLADALRRLKYGGRAELARPLGKLLADAALPYAGAIDRVLPIPLHGARLRERGFNQSALLAACVAYALSVPLDTRTLTRPRATRDQAGLARRERLVNMQGAFASRGAPPFGRRVLLIDDVETTGTTLTAASQTLVAAGFDSIHTLALARAEE